MSLADEFATKFSKDVLPRPAFDPAAIPEIEAIAPGFRDFITQLGGSSFRRGLYRIHSPSDIQKWTMTAEGAFPLYRGQIFCFAYDWLGRQFGLHRGRLVDGQAQTLLFDIGFHEVLDIPCGFDVLHRVELPEYADDALAARFHSQWLSSGGAAPGLGQCVGYRVPPSLGGKDEIANLEITDMDVYWELS
jgi:hypothetical protein